MLTLLLIAASLGHSNPPSPLANFLPGDIYLAAAATGGNCQGGPPGIVRIDGTTFTPTTLAQVTTGEPRWIRYDAHRDLLLTWADTFDSFHFIDAMGGSNLLNLPPVNGVHIGDVRDAAPTGTGIIYLRGSAGRLWLLDSANVLQPVIDASTMTQFIIGGFYPGDRICYDASTRSLYMLTSENPSVPCPSSARVLLKQVPLDGTGTLVIAPPTITPIGPCGSGPRSLGQLGRRKLLAVMATQDMGVNGFLAESIETRIPIRSQGGSFAPLRDRHFADWKGTFQGFSYGDYSALHGGMILYGEEVGAGFVYHQLWLFTAGASGCGFPIPGTLLFQDQAPASCPFAFVRDLTVIP